MLKTMLVDDDYLVRSYLKTLPAWQNAGFEISSDVRDGEEALNVLQTHPVDLIVTDISMPLMDGIELIRKVREQDSQVYIIVLSCHDDFEFVKEAMKLGADEYVLKNTLEDENLQPLLAQAKKKISERKQQKTGKSEASEPLAKEHEEASFLFFNKILSGVSAEEVEKMRKSVGISYPFHNCAVISMSIDQESPEQWFELEMEKYFREFYQRFCDGFTKVKEEENLHCEVVYLGAGVFCCFLDLSEERRSSVMSQRLIQAATACYRICKDEPYVFRIGASSICMGGQAVRQAYQQSREALKMGFYEEKQILYYVNDQRMSKVLPKKAEEFLKEANTLFYKKGQDEFWARSLKVGRAFEEEQTQSRTVVQWLRTLQEIVDVKVEAPEAIRSMKQVYDVLRNMAEKANTKDCTAIPSEVKGTVRAAAEYVLEHYKEPIGLTEVAEVVGVNSSYLSYIFSQEMAMGFSAFLLKQRMKCAKRMLRETNYKIREVAEQSGFNDYHHFAKTFKKTTGVSPAEYRKGN